MRVGQGSIDVEHDQTFSSFSERTNILLDLFDPTFHHFTAEDGARDGHETAPAIRKACDRSISGHAAKVEADIAAVPLATGVNNHEGSRATADDRVMRDVAAVLAQRHLFFIDSRTIASTVADTLSPAALA